MTNKRTTKQQLVASIVLLFMCFSMLLGTTFAWFTDSATSAGNKIVAGTLDVQLLMYNGTEYVNIGDSKAPIFGEGSLAQNNNAETLWEPGKTQVAYLAIKNNGNLDLKYQVAINVRDTDAEQDLYKALRYAVKANVQQNSVTEWTDEGAKGVIVGNNIDTTDVFLGKGETHYFALSVHMIEEAGNEFQGGSVDFDVKVLATQVASEADSFNNQYDKGAGYYPNSSAPEEVENAYIVLESNEGAKVTIPTAIVSDKEQVSINHTDIVCDAANKLVTIDAMELLDEDGNIVDLSANTTPFEVVLNVGGAFAAGETVLISHDGEIVATANVGADGTITYSALHFCAIKVAQPGNAVAFLNNKAYDNLQKAIDEANGATVLLLNNVSINEAIIAEGSVVIDGNGYTVARTGEYTGVVFNVKADSTLTLANVVVDGGAVWTGEANPVLLRGTVNTGLVATGALVVTGANAAIVLNEGAVLQNNDGANAVNLGTRTGGTLTINGGEIINNHSAAGAIWGGGAITINSGKVNGNHGGIGGAIRAVTNIGTLLTMKGGEMNHNFSDGNGGAIWAGGSKSNNVYVLNGGEMAYNYSATTGGAIYAGYYETVKIGGTFKMHDNSCAESVGSAIRFHDHASLVMTGGEVYNHAENAFFLNNNSASITGGKYVGNFGYSGGLGLTMGEAEIDGVITYNLATNHNTAYLAADFGSFKFIVNQGASNFAMFNFKPAADYTYTEGDEAKLICMNEGYVTYWDAASGTFKLMESVSNSEELKAAIEAGKKTIYLNAGDYSLRFTNNTAFNANGVTFKGADGVKLSISSSEVWYGRVQGSNVTFENIHFTSSVGTTGAATYNNCVFDDWTICASSNNEKTYFNNCTINGCLNTSVDFSSGDTFVKNSTVAKAEFSGNASMNFENCTIGELISWDMATTLTNCTVETLDDSHMSANEIVVN